MEQKSDEYYIEKVLNGDADAYRFLVEKHKNLAYTVAYRMSGNREDAEEIAQDAFVKVYRSLKSFRGKAKFSTWLYRIIYNTAVSRHRVKKRYVLSEDFAGMDKDDIESDGNYDNDREDKLQALERALNDLAEDEKFIVQLYYYSQTPVREMSSITGLSEANVKVKLFRARKKLQELVPLFMNNKME